MKLVKVVWEDAADLDEGPWVHKEGLKESKATIFHQVGWLVEHTKEAIVLTSCVGEDHIGIRGRIPLGMIKEMRVLDEGELLSLIVKKTRQRKSP